MNTFRDLKNFMMTLPPGLYSWSVNGSKIVQEQTKIILHIWDDNGQMIIRQLLFDGLVCIKILSEDKIEIGVAPLDETGRIFQCWSQFDLDNQLKILGNYGGNRGKMLFSFLNGLQPGDFL